MLRRRLQTTVQEKALRVYVKVAGANVVWDDQDTFPVVTSLQEALDTVVDGGEIWVANGTFKPARKSLRWINEADYLTNDRFLGFYASTKSLSIIGGFTGNEEFESEVLSNSYTTIDGDLVGDGINSDKIYCAFYFFGYYKSIVLKNLHIKNCRNDYLNEEPRGCGSAIFAQRLSIYTYNLRITDNWAYYRGNVVFYFCQGFNLIEKTLFENNYALNGGGGVYSRYYTATVRNSVFKNNSANYYGGAILCYASSSRVFNHINCLFINNNAGRRGAAISGIGGSIIVLKSCSLISEDYVCPLICGYTSASGLTAYVYNSIAIGQTYPDYGGHHSIVNWYNCLVEGSGGSDAWVHGVYSVDQGGNIDTDPLFTDEVIDDYTLQAISPCIDTGDNSHNSETEDLIGNPRVVDGDEDGTATVDIGAYEYQPFIFGANKMNNGDFSNGLTGYEAVYGADITDYTITNNGLRYDCQDAYGSLRWQCDLEAGHTYRIQIGVLAITGIARFLLPANSQGINLEVGTFVYEFTAPEENAQLLIGANNSSTLILEIDSIIVQEKIYK